MTHYVVAIGYTGGKGWRKVLSRHASQHEAVLSVLSRSCSMYSIVYRNGETGQRYSWEECRRLATQASA